MITPWHTNKLRDFAQTALRLTQALAVEKKDNADLDKQRTHAIEKAHSALMSFLRGLPARHKVKAKGVTIREDVFDVSDREWQEYVDPQTRSWFSQTDPIHFVR